MKMENTYSDRLSCLYFLENNDTYLLEVKRTDLPQDADLSDIYKWLMINKDFSSMQSLTFRSMDSSLDIEERFFEEGFLKFNQLEGTFIEKFNSAQHQFTPKDCELVPQELMQYITQNLLK